MLSEIGLHAAKGSGQRKQSILLEAVEPKHRTEPENKENIGPSNGTALGCIDNRCQQIRMCFPHLGEAQNKMACSKSETRSLESKVTHSKNRETASMIATIPIIPIARNVFDRLWPRYLFLVVVFDPEDLDSEGRSPSSSFSSFF